jgi:hypothetical protein
MRHPALSNTLLMCSFSTSASLTLRDVEGTDDFGGAIASLESFDRIMARSTTLRTSRMLPGQEYRCSAAMSSREMPSIRLPSSVEN